MPTSVNVSVLHLVLNIPIVCIDVKAPSLDLHEQVALNRMPVPLEYLNKLNTYNKVIVVTNYLYTLKVCQGSNSCNYIAYSSILIVIFNFVNLYWGCFCMLSVYMCNP